MRALKNRFGPTDEVGCFDMTGAGIAEVPYPSALFLWPRVTRARHLRRDRPGGPPRPAGRGAGPHDHDHGAEPPPHRERRRRGARRDGAGRAREEGRSRHQQPRRVRLDGRRGALHRAAADLAIAVAVAEAVRKSRRRRRPWRPSAN